MGVALKLRSEQVEDGNILGEYYRASLNHISWLKRLNQLELTITRNLDFSEGSEGSKEYVNENQKKGNLRYAL